MAESRLCSIPNCGKPQRARGLCQNHYHRLWRQTGVSPGRASHGEPQRFYHDVVLPYEGDECLIWPYATTNGYGVMRFDGRMAVISRYLCREANGEPPSPELDAAHSCGRGKQGCVTKRHLSWKTHSENCADMADHGTLIRGERSNFAKLSEAEVREILSLKGTDTMKAIAKRFGVSGGTVSLIYRGKTWASLQSG